MNDKPPVPPSIVDSEDFLRGLSEYFNARGVDAELGLANIYIAELVVAYLKGLRDSEKMP